jgi:hypothetical protein
MRTLNTSETITSLLHLKECYCDLFGGLQYEAHITHHTSHITLTHSLTSAFCLLTWSFCYYSLTAHSLAYSLIRVSSPALTHTHSLTHSLTHHFTLPPLITQFQPYRRPVFGTKMCTRSVTDRQRENKHLGFIVL